jgi:hypothetical protein
MNNLICGCEQGGDCTKTTVCAIDTATEDLRDRIVGLEAELAAANAKIERVNNCPVHLIASFDSTGQKCEVEAVHLSRINAALEDPE